MSLKPNIMVAPNIYVRSTPAVQNDDEFIKRVYGYKALNTLKVRFPKSYAAKLTRAQIEEMKQNVICRHGKTREHAYGKALSDGQIVWSCRCEHSDCHAYEKCMSLPNALRIERSGLINTVELGDIGSIGDSGGITDPEVKENAGFDYDDCNFEPPHTGVVLPLLNDILFERPENPESEKAVNTENTGTSAENFVNRTNAVQSAEPSIYEYTAEMCRFSPDKRVLVICENAYEVGYFSTILYKNGVRHRTLRSEGCTLNRRIADVFWDFCGNEIDRDAFLMRYTVRAGESDEEALEFYDALYRMCGTEGSDSLEISKLADALNHSPELISECILNMDDSDCPVTLSTLELISVDEEYDEVMILGWAEDAPAGADAEAKQSLYRAVAELFGSPPPVICKESLGGWVFSKSGLGRPCRVGLNNYNGEPGRYCLNVELGLWGDIDGKCFLTDWLGDELRSQSYIAENIKEGDELVIKKDADTGKHWFWHNGNNFAEFPAAIIREARSIEGFPDDFAGFEGVYVRNIVTCISEGDDPTVPQRFRESRIWLGLDITGYAKVLI